MNKKWEFYEKNEKRIEKVQKENGISKMLATILVNKNLEDKQEIEVFLNPKRNDFHNPYLMPDMEIAVNRIIKAMQNKEKVIIYGDYDVDGITSITVLKKFLNDRGLHVDQYIPNRLDEGYGLNKTAIEKIVSEKYDLMITVDCGISGIEEIDFANSLGLETIVTDHHEPADVLPNALAVVDAKRRDNKYPFNQLAGVGVVFKLIQAIGIKYNLEEKEYLKYLDLVCVGTISDIVPLVDENRVIAKLGLKLVEVTKNIGLKILLRTIGYKVIDSAAISFGVAPRINACGRMGHEKEALKLFLTESVIEATEISKKLNEYNKQRQETEREIFDEVVEKIEKTEQDKPAIVLADEKWHHGVIGIVASKVTEMYYKPSILICYDGDEGKGSGRSIPGFDLHEALTNCSKYINKFGGHAMAIGINVNKENFQNFKDDFEKFASKSDIKQLMPIIKVDEEVELKDVQVDIIKQLSLLEPFGEANKRPIFMCRNLRINSIRALSDGKHLKLTLKQDNDIIDAIGFNMGYLVNDYLLGDKVDVVGNLEINNYNGWQSVQMSLNDIRKSY